MKTEEAIEKVSEKYEGWQGEGWQGYARTQKEADMLGKERDEVIKLLKRGEKFERMWKGLKSQVEGGSLFEVMDSFEQKKKE